MPNLPSDISSIIGNVGGLPKGGVEGELLSKIDSNDFNTEWIKLDTDSFLKNNIINGSPTVNNLISPGTYYFVNMMSINVGVKGPGILKVSGNSDNILQEWHPLNDTQMNIFQRRRYSGTWSDWKSISPEYLANINGKAILFSNDVAICSNYLEITLNEIGEGVITYPIPFTEIPTITYSLAFNISTDIISTFYANSTTGFKIRVHNLDKTPFVQPQNISYIAIGKYK
jgi:hypothetical protein